MFKKLLISALATITSMSYAASFDCAIASNNTEKLICGNEALSALDSQLASVYKQALETSVDKDSFKQAQRDWIKRRNQCVDVACLSSEYKKRLSSIQVLLAKTSSNSTEGVQSRREVMSDDKKWNIEKIIVTGSNVDLCKDYLALIKRAPRNPKNSCGLEYNFDEKSKSQGFSEIFWNNKNPASYESLLSKYWMYLHRTATDEYKNKYKDQFYDVILKNKLFIWNAVFDLNNDKSTEEVFKVVSGDCMPGKAMYFIVSEKGLSAKRADETIDVNGNLFIYKGKSYIGDDWSVQELSGGDVYVNQGLTVCEFKNK